MDDLGFGSNQYLRGCIKVQPIDLYFLNDAETLYIRYHGSLYVDCLDLPEMQYLLGNAQVLDWSQTIDVFVLKYGISKQQYGVATAAGMFKSVVAIILLLAANFTAKKLDEDTLI